MKKILITVIALVSSISLVFSSFSPIVSASSIYDHSYQSTDSLYLFVDSGPTQCDKEYYGYKWTTLISTDISGVSQSTVDSFKRAQDGDGRWSVSMSDVGHISSISFVWTEDNSLSLTWFSNFVRTTGHTLTISLDGDCKPYATVNGFGFSSVSNPPHTKNFIMYIDEENINYPDGYEGEKIKDKFIEPSTRFYPVVTFTANKYGEKRKLKAEITPTVSSPKGVKWELVRTDQYYQNGVLIDSQSGVQPTRDWLIYEFDDLLPGTHYTLNVVPQIVVPNPAYDGVGVQFQFYFDDYFITSGSGNDYCNVEFDNMYTAGSSLTPPYLRCNINYESSDVPEDPRDLLANTPFGRFADRLPTFGLMEVFTAPLGTIAKISSGSLVCSQSDNFGIYAKIQGTVVLNERLPCFASYLQPMLNSPVLGFNGVSLGFTIQSIVHTVVGGITMYFILVRYFRLLDRSVKPTGSDKIKEVDL